MRESKSELSGTPPCRSHLSLPYWQPQLYSPGSPSSRHRQNKWSGKDLRLCSNGALPHDRRGTQRTPGCGIRYLFQGGIRYLFHSWTWHELDEWFILVHTWRIVEDCLVSGRALTFKWDFCIITLSTRLGNRVRRGGGKIVRARSSGHLQWNCFLKKWQDHCTHKLTVMHSQDQASKNPSMNGRGSQSSTPNWADISNW